MKNAEFHETTYTIPGTSRVVYLKYLLCAQEDITVRSISGSVKDSGYFGVNGTFFAGGNLIGVAINNGSPVRNYGTMNRDPRQVGDVGPIACGTYFYFNSIIGNTLGGSAVIDDYEGTVYNGITLSVSNTKFAIGGTSLFTAEENLTQSEFTNRMVAENAPDDGLGHRSRTAIIYLGGRTDGFDTVLLTVHGPVISYENYHSLKMNTQDNVGVTLWELRALINEVFRPMKPDPTYPIYHAIALDGGGSTQIAYKNEYDETVSYQVQDYKGNTNRTVYCMLSVPM